MKKWITSLCLLASMATAAQSPDSTTLLQALKAASTDTTRAAAHYQLFLFYREQDSAAAMLHANEAIALQQAAGNKAGEALYMYNKGVFLNINGENEAATTLLRQSLQLRSQLNDFAGQGYCLRALGTIEYDKNDYDAALKLYLQAAPLFEKGKDLKGLSGVYIWIGNVFNEGLKQFDKAADYFGKSLDIAKQLKDSALMSYNYNNLGQSYYYDSNYVKALEYYQLSKQIKQQLGDERGLGNAYSNLCNVYYELKDYRKALAYNDSSLAIRQKQNDKKGMATCYMNGADAWLQLKDYPRAFAGFQQALALGREINFMEAVIESYDGLSAWYEANGQPAEALRFYKLYKQASDSVYNAGISQQIASLQTKYETGKKEQQLQLQQYELTRKNMWLWGGAVVVALLMALGYSSYRRLRLRKEKQLQETVLKQQELATKAVMDAEENERRRIATELHDGVGQLMSAARMNLGAFESELSQLPPDKIQQFERIVQLVDESCREVRTVSHSMMPNALLKRGLAAAVRDFLDKIDSKILKVNLYVEGLDTRLDANTESMLYRIIQECVNNVIKHSGANQLDISLTREESGISLTVEDNGKGFDSSRREAIDGIGLKNIVSRVQVLKGEVEFDSQPGRGTLVAIYVPTGGSVV